MINIIIYILLVVFNLVKKLIFYEDTMKDDSIIVSVETKVSLNQAPEIDVVVVQHDYPRLEVFDYEEMMEEPLYAGTFLPKVPKVRSRKRPKDEVYFVRTKRGPPSKHHYRL